MKKTKSKAEPSGNLFSKDGTVNKVNQAAEWYLATNHRNLFYMLAAGMVMSPKGFGRKYYKDTLSYFPGWIPLFANKAPRSALDLSVSEKKHLIPCIVKIKLESLHGRLTVIDNNNITRKAQYPEEIDNDVNGLLIQAPLPIHWIEAIIFSSKTDVSKCEADSRDFGNVPLKDFKLDINSKLFSGDDNVIWPIENVELPNTDELPANAFAAGGIITMLLHTAKHGDIATKVSQLAFSPELIDTKPISETMIAGLSTWLKTGSVASEIDVSAELFWGAVNCIAGCHAEIDIVNPIDVLLTYLENSAKNLDDKMKTALLKLVNDLRKLAVFTDDTITELFNRHPKPFSRAMTLFVLREKCDDLKDFYNPLLTELDYVAAAILFGARDGWLGLQLTLRDYDGLQAAVSHRMVEMAHRLNKTGLEFGLAPSRPVTFRELFVTDEKEWSAKQKDAAILLARESNWNECIQTRINLGKGEYHLIINGSGVQILLEGEVKAVKTEIDAKKMLERIAHSNILDKIEDKVRKLIGS